LIPALLEALNSLDYYHSPAPKSLGREWVERHVMPLMDTGRHSIPDMLHTFVIHIAMQAGKATEEKKTGSMLITGGGAYNDFLIDSIRSQTQLQVHIPEPAIIEFKEALVFAFLGYLRIREIPNCLSSVTGARSNACGGAVYLP
jgi:anhydro-N-acetylmuramic acid kinase